MLVIKILNLYGHGLSADNRNALRLYVFKLLYFKN